MRRPWPTGGSCAKRKEKRKKFNMHPTDSSSQLCANSLHDIIWPVLEGITFAFSQTKHVPDSWLNFLRLSFKYTDNLMTMDEEMRPGRNKSRSALRCSHTVNYAVCMFRKERCKSKFAKVRLEHAYVNSVRKYKGVQLTGRIITIPLPVLSPSNILQKCASIPGMKISARI
jgi:hypothetical protein